jgi:hypothetical protein
MPRCIKRKWNGAKAAHCVGPPGIGWGHVTAETVLPKKRERVKVANKIELLSLLSSALRKNAAYARDHCRHNVHPLWRCSLSSRYRSIDPSINTKPCRSSKADFQFSKASETHLRLYRTCTYTSEEYRIRWISVRNNTSFRQCMQEFSVNELTRANTRKYTISIPKISIPICM